MQKKMFAGVAIFSVLFIIICSIDERIGSLIFSILLLALLCSWGMYMSFMENKNATELAKNGKKVSATVVDYLAFEWVSMNKSRLFVYPVLEFYDENNVLHKQIYTGSTDKMYDINEIITIYYRETNEIEQLNIEENIFLNRKYEKIKLVAQDKDYFNRFREGKTRVFLSSMWPTLTSEVYQDKISSFPRTSIGIGDIWIEGLEERQKKATILAFVMLGLFFIGGLAVVYYWYFNW